LKREIIPVGCIGSCYAEPIIGIFSKAKKEGALYGPVNKNLAKKIIKENIIEDKTVKENILGTIQVSEAGTKGSFFESDFMRLQSRQILGRCGLINPEDINHYLATGGYTGLLKALEMGADEIINTIKRSGLRGRGGAGSPWLKWNLCRQSNSQGKYIIYNADEGDPGAFMNRSLLEGDPHSVLEGILIGVHTIKAKKAYIYCRAEYPAALKKLKKAIKDLEKIGLLNTEIVIKKGAGAFVCGEETALMASIEGRRGVPRTRPPFPTTKGL